MTFLFPLGLLALLTLPVIVLLHLIRERRQRVMVPSLLLWLNLPQKPIDQKRSRLPLTLLLFLHLLVAALIAIALAQPQWLGDLLGSERHLAVIIDTSTSMAARESGLGLASNTRLDRARARAQDLVNGVRGNDTIALITAGPQVRMLGEGGAEQNASFSAALANITVEGVGTDVIGALTLAQAALENHPNGRIIILSDAAFPLPTGALANAAALPPVEIEQIGATGGNRAVVMLAARSWNSSTVGGSADRTAVQVYTRIASYGGVPLTTQLQLLGDDQVLDTRSVNLQPDGEAELTWTLPPGIRTLRVEFDGQDNLPDDDTASLSLAQARPLTTLLVSATPQALERALDAVPNLQVSIVNPAEYANSPLAANADLTVFDGVLPNQWPIGGVLVINPPVGVSSLLDISAALPEDPSQAQSSLIAAPSATLLNGLSLSGVHFGPAQVIQTPPWATVALASGDTPLILRGRTGQSEIAIWTFDLVQSNLATRLAFPLLVARTVRDLTPPPLPSALLAGDGLPSPRSPQATHLEVLSPDGSTQIIDVAANGQATSVAAPELNLVQAGIYTLTERRNEEVIYTGQVAVNAGSPLESDLRPRASLFEPASNQPLADLTGAASQGQRDRQPLWSWVIILVLLVMLIEWMYIHRRTARMIGANR
ncbi:MAG: VWA domain-containing protein [Chloroflexales bacterium]|nr:VWA domain-containing protein [Chloroflexales bacterium]